MEYRISEVTRPGELVSRVYREVLVPAFPAEELESEASVEEALADGTGSLFAAVDAKGDPAGGAFGRWLEAARVQLLSQLAVTPETRGHGLGRRLLHTAVGAWGDRYDPCAVVAEIESPDARAVHEAYGDPRRRLAFYEAAGARVLDLPYFQPGIGGREHRVPRMLLLVLHAAPALTPDDPDRLSGTALREFMTAYLTASEGEVAQDWDTEALFKAVDREGGVPMGRWRDPR